MRRMTTRTVRKKRLPITRRSTGVSSASSSSSFMWVLQFQQTFGINRRFQFFDVNPLRLFFQENECFQEALRSTQRKLLKVNRDKSFLLDRLLQYEKVDASFSESDETESSDDETSRLDTSKRFLQARLNFSLRCKAHLSFIIINSLHQIAFRKKIEPNVHNHSSHHQSAPVKPLSNSKKKKSVPKATKAQNTPVVSTS